MPRRPRPKGKSRNGGGPSLWKAKQKEHRRVERLFTKLEQEDETWRPAKQR